MQRGCPLQPFLSLTRDRTDTWGPLVSEAGGKQSGVTHFRSWFVCICVLFCGSVLSGHCSVVVSGCGLCTGQQQH